MNHTDIDLDSGQAAQPTRSTSASRLLVATVLVLASIATGLPAIGQQSSAQPSQQPSPQGPGSFVVRENRRPRPAITDAPFVAASAVTDQVQDNELVLGVVVDGKPRAYPVNQLTGPSREIVNDMLGGRAIAATW